MSDRLTEIAARAAAASDGRWQPYRKLDGSLVVYAVRDREIRPLFVANQASAEDTEFTARAREDVPWLLAQLEQARAIAVELENENARLRAEHPEAVS
ncbi:hypothetical protein [Streptomyces nigrescens]|uniref:Ead/Ea22-like family protein n=1 Tax=Streptomyces nigrescens TaxID=1920 RepID=A0A640TER1_STRNI|nr:hypothetical protein [Streptomyces libani]WAT94987.1 hypothetical protein STRLI_000660 [Streptomyces libani subsp. libani]GFE20145.1 hypothetical protein Sliba_05980 [Streptomyces libani subsp. libani]GGV85977.1 hypothetical protein GCM10010500_03420 [Streptomyces libani subsp. libani]